MKKNTLLLVVLLSALSSNAQETKKYSTLIAVGYGLDVLENINGYYVGINPTVRLSPKISLEGQVSYLYSDINSTFISGKEGSANSVNTLVGGRFYLSPEEKKNRVYFNLLLGLNYSDKTINGEQQYNEFTLGGSVGGFIKLNKAVLGLTFDTPANPILKAGYTF